MKILVVGSGGREHALVWKLARDRSAAELFCAPGNAGTASEAHNLPIKAEDVEGIAAWAKSNRPDLVVIGPEVPLCAGLADRLHELGIKVFGPVRAAAHLEGSKVFSKDVMEAAGVPTATSRRFTDMGEALAFVRSLAPPMVIKADGLAAGKGVVIAGSVSEAERSIRDMMESRLFGAAGAQILVEEFLEGEEASILALVDGRRVVMLAAAQDHKRVFDRDQGPNTGGMGAYSPAPVVRRELWPVIEEEVFGRTLRELNRRKIEYKGVLYAGLMIGAKGPKVLEFNCRFGDPETQAVLPRIAGDLAPALMACAEGALTPELVQWKPEACVCVVMTSGGYPGAYEKGRAIRGLEKAAAIPGCMVFHAGTDLKNGEIVTAGGRVLGVTALDRDLPAAVRKVYEAVRAISFEGAHYRTDIAARALP